MQEGRGYRSYMTLLALGTRRRTLALLVLLATGLGLWELLRSDLGSLQAEEPPAPARPSPFVPSAERGYRWLTSKAYVPSSIRQADVDQLWQAWPEALKAEAGQATPERRRELTWARYGITPRPGEPDKPLQYVVDEQGRWSMSCLACHGGQV
ncbi:MAG: hypothetical protein VKS61_10345, partial [Candidatus Sericytochromatia bacterium]|nr:hypothetical protein [Candidatus Sericytochromatia bacterium]